MKMRLVSAVGAALVSLGLASAASAALLVDIKPDPPSPFKYELSWSGTNLSETPLGPNGGGAISNGDGVAAATLGPQQQTVGGLLIGTPLDIRPVFGPTLTAIGGINNATDNSSTFYDVTLHLTLLNGVPPANVNPVVPGITVITQPIGVGTFELLSTPDVTGKQTLLLSGTVTDMVIVGLQGQTTASVQSTTVVYNGGLIFQRLQQIPNSSRIGQLSLSLLDVNTLGGLDVGANTQLKPFDANMTGLFSAVIPEPASLSILGLGALCLFRRSRK